MPAEFRGGSRTGLADVASGCQRVCRVTRRGGASDQRGRRRDCSARGFGSECKHGLRRRVCATCRQQRREKHFGPSPKPNHPAVRVPGETGEDVLTFHRVFQEAGTNAESSLPACPASENLSGNIAPTTRGSHDDGERQWWIPRRCCLESLAIRRGTPSVHPDMSGRHVREAFVRDVPP